MKNEAKDMLLREKLNTLDPLSGGIVFGKEEAWEKLQARMEQRPKNAIPVRYWLAAAAMLLLFVCVTVFYHTPSQELTNKNETTYSNTAVVPPPAIATPPADVPQSMSSVITDNKPVSITIKEKKTEKVVSEIPVQVTHEENIVEQNVVRINTPAPVAVSPQPMKTYYIGDVEHKITEPQAVQAAGNASVDISKLPTIHITEVEREETEVKGILRENRMSEGKHNFFRPAYNDALPQEYNDHRNPLQSILNLKN